MDRLYKFFFFFGPNEIFSKRYKVGREKQRKSKFSSREQHWKEDRYVDTKVIGKKLKRT